MVVPHSMTPTTIRLNEDDDLVVDALQETGIASRTDIVRLVLGEAAEKRGIEPGKSAAKKPSKPVRSK